MQDVRNTFYDEIAFRIELAVAIILIPTAMLLPVSLIVHIFLIVSVLLVLIIEQSNTLIEAAVIRICTDPTRFLPKQRMQAGTAVLMSSINLVVV